MTEQTSTYQFLIDKLNNREYNTIVLGGSNPQGEQVKSLLEKSDLIIAADSGGDVCLSLGVVPQVIIGDFDSISAKGFAALQNHGTEIVAYEPEKDYTDGELALNFALDHQAKTVIIIAAKGDRFDHTLANIYMALPLVRCGVEVIFCFDHEIIYIIGNDVITSPLPQTMEISGRIGDTISLLPLTSEVSGITLSGLKYSLSDETIALGRSIGVSNVFVETTAHIVITQGLLLVVHNFLRS